MATLCVKPTIAFDVRAITNALAGKWFALRITSGPREMRTGGSLSQMQT